MRAIEPIATCQIALAEHMTGDIKTYLTTEVETRTARGLLKLRQKDLTAQIIEALNKTADGM